MCLPTKGMWCCLSQQQSFLYDHFHVLALYACGQIQPGVENLVVSFKWVL